MRVEVSLAQVLEEQSQRDGVSPAGPPQGKGIVVRRNSTCKSVELQNILTRNAHCGREVGVGRSDHCLMKPEAWVTGQTEFSL